MTDRESSSNTRNNTSLNGTSSNSLPSNGASSSNVESSGGTSRSGRIEPQTPQELQNEEPSQNTGLASLDASAQNPDNIDDQVRYYRNFLQQFLGVVTSSDEETVSRIITLIRSGASPQQILAALSQLSDGRRRTGQEGGSGRENGSQRR